MADVDDATFSNSASDFRCDSPTGSHTSSGVSDGGGGRIALTSSISQCSYGAGGSFTDIGAGGQWSSLSRCGEGFRGSSSSLASVCSSASQFASPQPRRESLVEAIEKKRRENVSARLRNQLQLMQQRSMSVDVADGPVSVADHLDAPQPVEMPVIAALPRRSRDTVLPRQPRRNSAYQPIVGGMAITTGRPDMDSASDLSSSTMSSLRRHSLTSSGVLESLRGGRRSLSVFDDGVRSDEPPLSSMLMTSSLTSPRFRDTLSETTFPNKGNKSDEYQSAAAGPQLDFNDVPDKRAAISSHMAGHQPTCRQIDSSVPSVNDGRFVLGKIQTNSASDNAFLDSSGSLPRRNELHGSRYRHVDSKYDLSPAGDELVASGDDESVSSFTFLSEPPDYKPDMPPDDAIVVSAHSKLLSSPSQRPQPKLNDCDITKAKTPDTPSSYRSIQSQPVSKAADRRPEWDLKKSDEADRSQVRLEHPTQKHPAMNEISGTTTSTVERVDDVIRVSSARPRLQRPSSQPTPSDIPTYRNQNSVDVTANRESPLSICSQRPPVMPKSSIYRSAVSLNMSTPLSPPVKTGNAALSSARQQRQTGPPTAVRRSSASGRLVSTDTPPVLPYRRTDPPSTTTSEPSSSAEDVSAARPNGGRNSVAAISAMFEQSKSRPSAENSLSRSASAPEKASEVVRKKDDDAKKVGDVDVVVAAQPPPLPTSAQPSDVVIAAAKVMQQLNTWENDIDRDMGRKAEAEVDFNLRFPGRPRSLRLHDKNSTDQLSTMSVIGPEPTNAPLPPPSPSKISALSITMNAPSSPSTRQSLSSPPIAQFDDASDLDLYPLLPMSPPPAEIPTAAVTTPPMATPPPLPSSTMPVDVKHQKLSTSGPQQSNSVNEETNDSVTPTVNDDHKTDHCKKPAELVHDTTPLSPTLREFSTAADAGRGRQQSFDEAFKYNGNGNLGSETDVLFSRMNRHGNSNGAVLTSSQRSRPTSAGFSASTSQASPTRATISAAAVARGIRKNDVRENKTTGTTTTSISVNHGRMSVPTVVRPTSAVEKSTTTPSVDTERKGSRDELHIVPVVVTSEVSGQAKGRRTVTEETTVAENNHKDPGNSESDEDSHVQPVSRTIRKMQLQIAAANSSIRPEVNRRPAPAPTRTTSWTNVTSNTEFVFAPTKSVTPSTHSDHVTSAAVVTTSKLAVYSPEVAESDDERASCARRTDAVERSWESCMGPGNSRSAVRVLPRAGNQPAPSTSGPSSSTFVAQNVRCSDSNSKPADVGDRDAITIVPVVKRDRKHPVLVPVTVQHETTIPVKTTTVSADQMFRGKSLTSLSTALATSNGDAHSDELSNMYHVSSMPNMADKNGLSGEKGGARERFIPISIVNGSHSAKDNGIDVRRPEVFKISNAIPVNDTDEETFEIDVLKSGLGLSFCIEGGVGSANGDQPITVKRVFRAGEQLRPGDELLTANGRPLTLLSHYVAWNYLKSLPEGIITLVVRRRRLDACVDVASPMASPTTADACLTRVIAGQRMTGIEIAAS